LNPGQAPAVRPRGRLARRLFLAAWLLPTMVLLGLCRLAIVVVPFSRLAARIGRPIGAVAWVPLVTPEQRIRASQVGQVVRAAARRTPWVSNCFPQAVAARLLLGLYGVPYVIHFGLARDAKAANGFRAHAWVVAGRERVTGGNGFARYQVVGAFAAPRLVDPA
jgi:hypothetical protein